MTVDPVSRKGEKLFHRLMNPPTGSDQEEVGASKVDYCRGFKQHKRAKELPSSARWAGSCRRFQSSLGRNDQQFRKVVHSLGLGVRRLFFWVRPGPEAVPSAAAHSKSEDTPPAWGTSDGLRYQRTDDGPGLQYDRPAADESHPLQRGFNSSHRPKASQSW